MKPRIVLLYARDQNFDRVLTEAFGGTGVVVLTARSVADALQIVCQRGSELDFAVNRRAEAEVQALSRKLNAMIDKLDDLEDAMRRLPPLNERA